MNVFNPVVLLGPGRSGTTLLYKLLCLHPSAAFISNYDERSITRPFARLALRLAPHSAQARRRAWFSDKGQAYFKRHSLLQKLIPTPVEGEAVYRACGMSLGESLHPVEPPIRDRLRRRFSELQKRQQGGVLVLKRTANNRRIPALDSALPEARYVLIWRDGRAVAASLLAVDWWLDHHVWWAEGKTPREMNLDRQGMIALAARNWVEEVAAIERGLLSIQPSRILTIRYESLLQAPERTLGVVQRFIGLEASPEHTAEVRNVGLAAGAEKWRSSLSPAELSNIERIAEAALKHLSYQN